MKIFGYTIIGLLIAALVVAFITASTLFSGFVLATLWGWFLVPTLHVGAITTLQAAGISVVVKFLTYQVNIKELLDTDEGPDKWKKPAAGVIFAFVYPLLTLLVGWVIHQFI